MIMFKACFEEKDIVTQYSVNQTVSPAPCYS